MAALWRAGSAICRAEGAHLALKDRDMAAGGPPAAAPRQVSRDRPGSPQLAAPCPVLCKPQIKLGAMHARLATRARLSLLF